MHFLCLQCFMIPNLFCHHLAGGLRWPQYTASLFGGGQRETSVPLTSRNKRDVDKKNILDNTSSSNNNINIIITQASRLRLGHLGTLLGDPAPTVQIGLSSREHPSRRGCSGLALNMAAHIAWQGSDDSRNEEASTCFHCSWSHRGSDPNPEPAPDRKRFVLGQYSTVTEEYVPNCSHSVLGFMVLDTTVPTRWAFRVNLQCPEV
jgi:hypothetical protein